MRAAVLGSPIAHSLSPVIHNAGFAAAGLIDWSYDKHQVSEDELASFVAGLGAEWVGLSLTMPLKEVALDVADEVRPIARLLGAANTLVRHEGGWIADNTDAAGLVDALAEAGVCAGGRVAILGAGGTARAALGAAAQLGAVGVTVYARREAAIDELKPAAEALALPLHPATWDEARAAGEADIVISTVPKGVADDLEITWHPAGVLFDVVYDPWPTALAAKAEEAGCLVLPGHELLLAQAVRQWKLFTGRKDAPVAQMRSALATAIG
ncbi:shikimate dehydrogenase [Natronoglycomyces albus]|uniref:Shikimate dehydrogenase n=1 Tax=Natronoglycomyces albus TaxID=2811108 RepID=A0A895XNJ8_9ACTN|nr:shikimate dehydrogenase [Natronoglycomyces albus]QSB03880.1 shikimate dehydrogenase [Natronoglycomyces albus]